MASENGEGADALAKDCDSSGNDAFGGASISDDANQLAAQALQLGVHGTLTETGWLPPAHLTYNEWKAAGRVLEAIGSRIQWAIGDWWHYGNHAYGERAKVWAEGAFGDLKLETLRTYGWVAGAVDRRVRCDDLSFEHHRVVATFEPEQQAKFLDEARDSSLSVKALRTAVGRYRRRLKHEAIRAGATEAREIVGPYPLIYADPPWEFIVRSELGKEMSSPENHYPTLSDDEIANLRVDGKTIPELASTDAALFLWCTSSNIPRAEAIMAAWGFEFKSSATWVKDRTGTGYIFRNQHELLLYGTRGNMPAPVFTPSSVFQYPRGEHSAKPPEIRQTLESMYPAFDRATRIELFARDESPDWTVWGFEA